MVGVWCPRGNAGTVAALTLGLTLDGKGHLFGVTSSGGQYGGGTAFEITQ